MKTAIDKISSIEAEEATLGSILINPEALDQIPWLKADDFFEVKNGWIFQTMKDLAARNMAIDNLTVVEALRQMGKLVEVGGAAYITYLINSTPTHIYVATYAGIVEIAARKRRAIAFAGEIAQTASEQPAALLLPTAMKLVNMLQDAEKATTFDPLRDNLVHVSELKNLPPLSWLLPGEIPEFGLVLVYGPSGVGKSFFTLDYALRLAEDIPVVYIASEGEAGYTIRVAAWARHHQRDIDRYNLYFYMNIVALLDDKERAAFVKLITPIHPKLIIVDTLAHAMLPGNENDTRDMGLFLKASKKIQRELNCAIVMVHHTNKSSDNERGSSALRGACDMMIRLGEEDQVIAVTCTKSKDTQPFATRYMRLLPVQLPDGLSSPVLIPAHKVTQTKADPLTPLQQRVLDAFGLDCFQAGASLNDIAESTTLNRGTVQRISSRLAVLGFLIRVGGNYQISNDGQARLQSASAHPTDSSTGAADSGH